MLRAPAKTVGIAWYRREAYAAARGVMDDAQVLPVDYDTWLRTAELIVLLEEAKGSEVVRATIDPPVFAAWCRATGRRPNVHARTRHVNLVVDDYCAAMRALRAGEEDERRDVEEESA